MATEHGLEKSFIRLTLTSIFVACLIFIGGGWLFVKIMDAARYPPAAATNATAPKPPAKVKLPDDVPLYKSGNIASKKEIDDVQIFEVVFTLGSIEQVKEFYEKEMPARGWQAYATGSNFKEYMAIKGEKKASLAFSYYAGKPKLRLTISKTLPEF